MPTYRKLYYQTHRDKILASNQRYRQNHKEELRAKNKLTYQANKKEYIARSKQYHEAHKETENAKRRLYYALHKKELNTHNRQYNQAHKEELSTKGKQYYQDHKEEIKNRHNLYRQTHRTTILAKKREYYQTHKDALNQHKKNYGDSRKLDLKIEVLTHYGNNILACVQCGYNDLRALSIDHIDGGGTEHRHTIHGNSYRWLKQKGFPDGYQTLCMNCQFVKRSVNNEFNNKGRYEEVRV